MRKQLGNAPCAAEPFGKPGTRLTNHSRAIRENVAKEEVPGQIEALSNFVPRCASAFADESRQGEQLRSVRLSLSGADGPAGLGADCNQVVVGSCHRAALEIEAEPQLREE